MKKTNKLISIILALLMLLSAVPMMSFAADELTGTCGDNAVWTLDLDSGEMIISGEGEVEFDDFEYKDSVKSLIIEDGITYIGIGAFENWFYLKNVVFECSEISIGEGAFLWDFSLESVEFKEGSTIEITECAFLCCIALEEVIFPEGSKYCLLDESFMDCISLKGVFFGEGSEGYIGDYAFAADVDISDEDIVNELIEKFPMYILGLLSNEEYRSWIEENGEKFDIEEPVKLQVALYGDEEIAAYAEANGFEFVSLEELGDMVGFACEVTPINHVPAEAVIENEVPATCTAEGSYEEVVYCSICGTELSRVKFTTAKAEHTLPLAMLADDDSKAPTCTENGKTASVACVICGTVIIPSETIPASGHRYEAVASTAATCSRKGTTTYQCVYCGDDYVKADKAKLAHVDGDSDGKCDVCSEVIGAVSTGKRCSFCSTYEQKKDTPVIGFFFEILHSIIHGISAK